MLLFIIFTDNGNFKCIFKAANNPELCFTVGTVDLRLRTETPCLDI